MTRINLLPPEERRGFSRGGSGLLRRPLELLAAAGAAVLAVLLISYLFFLLQLGGEREELARLDQDIARQEQQLAQLALYSDLQDRLAAKELVADGVWRARFPWDRFLQGLAFTIPESSALNSLTAEATPVDLQAPVGESLEPRGAVTFTGLALPDYQNVSDFVVRMNSLPFLANTRLVDAELDRETYEEPAIRYEASSEVVTVSGEDGGQVPVPVETSPE